MVVENGDENNELMLYANYVRGEDDVIRPIGYAYGKPWVAQALCMGDISFDTPEAAKEYWEKHYGKEHET